MPLASGAQSSGRIVGGCAPCFQPENAAGPSCAHERGHCPAAAEASEGMWPVKRALSWKVHLALLQDIHTCVLIVIRRHLSHGCDLAHANVFSKAARTCRGEHSGGLAGR